MSRAPDFILALDTEASGQNSCDHFLVEIGMSLVHRESEKVVTTFSSFVAQPAGTGWEPRCVREFWNQLPGDAFARAKEELERAPPAQTVRDNLLMWVRKNVSDPSNTIVATDTPGFDVCWLNHLLRDRSHLYLFTDEQGEPMFTPYLDTSSWYLGLNEVLDPNSSSYEAAEEVVSGLTGSTGSLDIYRALHTHRASDDATSIGLKLAHVMNALISD